MADEQITPTEPVVPPPEVTQPGNADQPGVAVKMVEGETAPAVDTTPETITLQPGDAPVDRPESLSDMRDPSRVSSVSVGAQILNEMDAGRERVRFHEEQQKLRDEKARREESGQSEESLVAAATNANKDL